MEVYRRGPEVSRPSLLAGGEGLFVFVPVRLVFARVGEGLAGVLQLDDGIDGADDIFHPQLGRHGIGRFVDVIHVQGNVSVAVNQAWENIAPRDIDDLQPGRYGHVLSNRRDFPLLNHDRPVLDDALMSIPGLAVNPLN